METMKWGTWEELVLGSAVLRHGSRAWDAVAAELRARTPNPYTITAEACRVKYEDLQERYCGCDAWFEELRKQRLAELKRELEKSDDSIGSLESKLESLRTDKAAEGQVDYGSSRTVSPAPLRDCDGGISSGSKDASKDGLSATSFTDDTRINWLPECRTPAPVSARESDTKVQTSMDSEREMHLENIGGGRGGSVRRKRGKRKRKECNKEVKEASIGESDAVKEGSVGESDMLSSAYVAVAAACIKDESTGYCDRRIRSSDVDDRDGPSVAERSDDLLEMFKSFESDENASVFRGRPDSQRKARYKKMIRRHMDLDTIRRRIIDRSITSSRELFRDLLLLANNALVFYPNSSDEYKSALSLRELSLKTFRRNLRKDSGDNAAAPALAEPPTRSTPVKPRSVRPSNRNVTGKAADTGIVMAKTTSREGKKAHDNDSPLESSVVAKRSVGRPVKVGVSRRRPETPARGRKRTRRS